SYGGEAGEIMDIQIHDSNGNATCNLKSGEMFIVGFKAKAYQKIESPIFALTIRDKRGQDIYGNNTLFAKKDTANLLPNDTVEVTFQQAANLAAGEYLISLGFTRFEGVDLQVIHRKYDTIKLNITSSDGSFGIANCHSKINCTIPKNEVLHATRKH
ncbi:MAG: hypothetical protein HOI70_03740, partial [Opitutae bacterium]|nr:hypothetical protein [Opitutae bacterium]